MVDAAQIPCGFSLPTSARDQGQLHMGVNRRSAQSPPHHAVNEEGEGFVGPWERLTWGQGT
ncbi:hypothetical protein MUK42_33591 [Musa troglodytarum]|uniref:Uncharacterized protein n=1 Tax=Musa troglodytarum TaxID=320322 RepID=A0A9E7LFY1_9LILI|nr:hypothetical protein MUK42_33591 [Musa troglodytarum]